METKERGFFSRIWRAFVILIIIPVIAVAAAVGVFFLDKEVKSGFGSVNARINANEARVNVLNGSLEELSAGTSSLATQARVLAETQDELAALSDKVAALETGLMADLGKQTELLDTMFLTLDTISADQEGMSSDIASYQPVLVALQSDINGNSTRLNEFGVKISNLQTAVRNLDSSVADVDGLLSAQADTLRAEFANPQAEIRHVQYTLSLFRVWEYVARARLRLGQFNVGLARTDVETAVALIDDLSLSFGPEIATTIAPISEQLNQALTLLPANSIQAERELETAWEQLDLLLTAAVIPAPMEEKEHTDAHWGYEGEEGPEFWAALDPDYAVCAAGIEQSPIDLTGATQENITNLTFNYVPSPIDIVNNGHTVQVSYEPGSTMEANGVVYELKQFHFHTPSEHTIEGVFGAVEMHLVHQSADGAYAVVGVMINPGAENLLFDAVWNNIPTVVDEPSIVAEVLIDATDLLPAEQTYFQYAGSFTTPPCTEGVSWYVMNTFVDLSADQIDELGTIMGENNRPVQLLENREIVEDTE